MTQAKEVSTQFGIASLTGPVTVETSTRLLAELDAVHVKEKVRPALAFAG